MKKNKKQQDIRKRTAGKGHTEKGHMGTVRTWETEQYIWPEQDNYIEQDNHGGEDSKDEETRIGQPGDRKAGTGKQGQETQNRTASIWEAEQLGKNWWLKQGSHDGKDCQDTETRIEQPEQTHPSIYGSIYDPLCPLPLSDNVG